MNANDVGSNTDATNAGVSVVNSAWRHKVDLAEYLIHRFDRASEEEGRREAVEHGWKGGDEGGFIRMVKDLEGDHSQSDGESDAIRKNESKEKVSITLQLPPTNWTALQTALLESNLLPAPIDRTQTSRKYSGLPSNATPALIGAKRGQISCPDTHPQIQSILNWYLAFWNDPRGTRDELSLHPTVKDHPFLPKPLPLPHDMASLNMKNASISKQIRLDWAKQRGKYLTFSPDTGGWNNLRMSFENILIYAAVSGRALVLPPDQNIYLLEPKKGDKGRQGRNYYDLFSLLDNIELLRRVPILTAGEFLELEGGSEGIVSLSGYNTTYQNHLWAITKECEDRKKSNVFCDDLYHHYLNHGMLAEISSEPPHQDCFIFDLDIYTHGGNGTQYWDQLSDETQHRIKTYCNGRSMVFYNSSMNDAPLWHFETLTQRYRLLIHFYGQNLFTDPIVDNYYKRFIRDYLRYHNDAMCAAGKIMLALQYEGYALMNPEGDGKKLDLDEEGVGGYSALHVRRGDLQFKEVRIEAGEWYKNTKEIW